MSIVAKTLAPLRQAAHQFFRCQVRLHTQGGLRLELAERDGTPRPPTHAELAEAREREEIRLMRTELAALLDADGDTRPSVRHLVFVEHAIAKEGPVCLYTMPVDVLQRALDQFESLVSNWSDPGLAALRSRMAVALNERDPAGEETEAGAYRAARPSGSAVNAAR